MEKEVEKFIYRLPDIIKMIGIKRATIYKMVNEGNFPRPIKLTTKCVGWKSADIKIWLNNRPLA